jgi:preprotein translocase subunit SecF
MIRILHGTNIDFIRWWKWAVGITAAFILLGLASFAIHPGINKSIEFTGGTMMQVQFTNAVDVGALRSSLDQAGITGAEIQQFGSVKEYTVRAQNAEQRGAATSGAETVSHQIQAILEQKYGQSNVKVIRTEAVGPRVGDELTRDAIIAMRQDTTFLQHSPSSSSCISRFR